MKVYPVFIPHAGCPHRCLFCGQDRSTGQVRVPLAPEVDSWLDDTLPEYGEGEVAFFGGTFSLLPLAVQELYLAIAQRYVASGRVAGVRISTRPDALSETIVARLQKSGVTTIEIGCQSFSDSVLSASGRGHAVADNVAAVKCCRNAGLQTGIQLMPGLPGSDPAEAMHSLMLASQLEPSFLRIYPTVVIAGTGLADLWLTGHYQPWTLDEAVDVCADMLHVCQRVGIPVIRLGLQNDRALKNNLLAGPYHPAFGQLVRSRLWRRALAAHCSDGRQCSVNPFDLSDALGHRGENRTWLEKTLPGFAVTSDVTVERGYFRMYGQDYSLLSPPDKGEAFG